MELLTLFRFRVRDEITGKWRITNYRLTVAAAREQTGYRGRLK